MTSQGTAHGRFQRAINRRHVQAAEMAAREMGGTVTIPAGESNAARVPSLRSQDRHQ
jgi:hypothetical protein